MDNKVKKGIGLAALSLVTAVNSASASTSSAAQPQKQLSEGAQRLIEDFKPFIGTIDRDYDTFHYTPRYDYSQNLWKSEAALEYVRRKQADFKKPSAKDEWRFLGDGLYLAQNPYQSGDYGKGYLPSISGWTAYMVTLPKGTVTLDIRSVDSKNPDRSWNRMRFPVRKSTYDFLKQNCPSLKLADAKTEGRDQKIDNEHYYFVDKVKLTIDSYCHQAFVSAVDQLNVGVITYKWHGTNKVPGCPLDNGDKKAAFVPVNLVFNHSNVKTINKIGPDSRMSAEELQTYQYVDFLTRRAAEANKKDLSLEKVVATWPYFGPEKDPKNIEKLWTDFKPQSDSKLLTLEQLEAKQLGRAYGCQVAARPAVETNGHKVQVITLTEAERKLKVGNIKCDDALKGFPFECEMQSRFRDVRKTLASYKVNVEQLANYRSTRFIGQGAWNGRKAAVGYIPWKIYSDQPELGWLIWERGALYMESLVRKNPFENALTLEEVADLNNKGMHPDLMTVWASTFKGNKPGKFRFETNPIRPPEFFMECDDPMSEEDMRHITSYDLWASTMDSRLVSAYAEKCMGGGKMSQKYRGNVIYLPTSQVETELTVWESYINYYWPKIFGVSKTMNAAELNPMLAYVNKQYPDYAKGKVSPIDFVSDAQRWFVSIHPFGDGNGRTSRFIQDYFIRKLDLPYPVSAMLWNDLFMPTTKYRKAMKDSMIAQVEHLESCAAEYKINQQHPDYTIDGDCLPLYQSSTGEEPKEVAAEKVAFREKLKDIDSAAKKLTGGK